MQNLKKRFKLFHHRFPYLNIQEQIENFAVFDGLKLNDIQLNTNVFENIKRYIIDDFSKLKDEFYDDEDMKMILQKLAHGDRKQYAIYKSGKLSQKRGKILYKELFYNQIIKKEFTREKIPKSSKHRPLKKELRRYVAEDKLRFTKNFHRFWYTFISPFENEISKTSEHIIKNIEQNLEKYISLTFEELSNELIKEKCFGLNIVETGSYWDKNVEIDILSKDAQGRYIVGECKWTNQKICKNILRKLQSKVKKLDFEVTRYALFSKNGFSNGFKKEKKDDTILFDLDTFKRLNDD